MLVQCIWWSSVDNVSAAFVSNVLTRPIVRHVGGNAPQSRSVKNRASPEPAALIPVSGLSNAKTPHWYSDRGARGLRSAWE